MKRREALKAGFKFIALALGGGLVWSVASAKQHLALRPPGAISEDKFKASCIRCGLCVLACPFDTLFLASAGSGVGAGTPIFTPRTQPCKMCPSIPCTAICPTDALSLDRLKNSAGKPDIASSRMGVAIVDSQHCLAYWGIRCDACYRACPLIDKAIKIEHIRNERTKAHAKFIPVVDNEVCTGCGMCERACITQKPSITILPRQMILGEVSDSYIKGWEADDEGRINDKNGGLKPGSSQSAQDYLNSGGEL